MEEYTVVKMSDLSSVWVAESSVLTRDASKLRMEPGIAGSGVCAGQGVFHDCLSSVLSLGYIEIDRRIKTPNVMVQCMAQTHHVDSSESEETED